MEILEQLHILQAQRNNADTAIKALQEKCPHLHVVMTFYLGECNDSSWEMRCLDCGKHGESRENAIYPGEDTLGNLKGKPTLELSNKKFLERFASHIPYKPLSLEEIEGLGKFKVPKS